MRTQNNRTMQRAAFQAFKRAGFPRKDAAKMVQACDGSLRQALREVVPYMHVSARITNATRPRLVQ